MTHVTIFRRYRELFPESRIRIFEYFPNGRNSIRVRFFNREEVIFTVTDEKNWKLETVPLFLKEQKEDRERKKSEGD